MSLTTFKKNPFIKAIVPFALASFLATLLPPRLSRADDYAPPGQGGHGSVSDPSAPSPTLNPPEALGRVDVSMGAALAEYDFKLPRARGDAQPSLGLRYNSQAGVGMAGMGWSLNVPAITRRGRSGIPRFQDAVISSPNTVATDLGTDDYYIDDKLLIPVNEPAPANLPPFIVSGPGDTQFVEAWIAFRTEVDDGTRYFFPTGMIGHTWIAQTKSGHILVFGDPLLNNGSGSVDEALGPTALMLNQQSGLPGVSNPIYRWNLVRDTDATGNSVVYVWGPPTTLFASPPPAILPFQLQYLTDIYDTSSQGPNLDLTAAPPPTNTFAHHVHLTWTLAQYPNTDPIGGFPIPYASNAVWREVPSAQLSAVDVTSDTMNSTGRQLVRRYQMYYSYNSTQTRAYLTTIQPIGDCEMQGSPIVETAGFIGTDSATVGRLLTCTGVEHMPATKYTYTGITDAGLSPPPTNFPSPKIVAETPAYGSPLPPDFLVDLDGDGAAELVAGTNGYPANPASQCISCSLTTGGVILDNATSGLYLLFGGNDTACQTNNSVCQLKGPTQADGTTFPVTKTNGMATLKADDAMFSEAVMGDWAPTGRKSFLQIWPEKLPVAYGSYFSNPHTNMLALGQFSGVMTSETSATYRDLFNAAYVPTADSQYVQAQLGASEPVPQVSGLSEADFSAGRGVDLDGDGLPDLGNVPLRSNGQISYTAFFSSRDRAGATHPLSTMGTPFCSTPNGLASTYPQPAGGGLESAFADMDGDGLADLIYYGKFGPNLATSGAHNYLNFHILINRGDGRFGLPTANPPTNPPCDQDYSTSVTPTAVGFPQASDPIGPETTQGSAIRFGDLNGDGMADYAALDSAGLHICLRYGASWDNAAYRCVTEDTLFTGNDQTSNATHPSIIIGDIDGSGLNQVVYFPAPLAIGGPPAGNATAIRVAPNNTISQIGGGPIDGLLQSISNGVGAVTSFSYQSVHELNRELGNIGAVPVPVWVVTQRQTTNSLVTGLVTTTTNYSYSNAVYDNLERRFIGFQNAQELTLGDIGGGSNGQVVKTTFATMACLPTVDVASGSVTSVETYGCDNPATAGYVSAFHARRGLPVAVETDEVLANGTIGAPFTTVINSYVFQNPYTGLDGRIGTNVRRITTNTYVWGSAAPASSPATWTIASALSPTTQGVINVPTDSGNVTVPAGVNPMTEVTTYDLNENRTSVVDSGGISVSATDIPIQHSWQWNLPPGDKTGWNWRITQEVTGYVSNTTSGPSREVDYAYDSLGRLTQTSRVIAGTATLLGPGGATRAAAPPGQSSDGPQATNYIYDSNGNVEAMVDSLLGCSQTFTFAAPYYELLASASTSPTGDCANGLLTTQYSYDRGLQLVTSAIDPANRITLTKYDDFGRVLEVDKPSLGAPMGTIAAFYVKGYSDSAPIRTVHFQTASGDEGTTGAMTAPQYVDHYVYTDGFGDVLAQVDGVDAATHQNNTWLLSGAHSRYQNGRVHAMFRPMYMTGSGPVLGTLPVQAITPTSPSTTRAYDGLGRIVSGTDYNGNAFKNVYGAFSVDVYDQEQTCAQPGSGCVGLPSSPAHLGHETRLFDGHGRMFEVDAHLPVGPDGTSGVLSTVTTFQATGEPLSIQQIAPRLPTATRTMTYDSQGRMVQNTEPNSGTWSYAYDNRDQLVGVSDARGCGENIGRDLAERVTFKDYIPCPSAAGASAQATYSAPQANGDGTEEFYAYDPSGQLTDAYDLARHDTYTYFPGGPVNTVTTQIAVPGGNSLLGKRYVVATPEGSGFQKVYGSYSVAGAPTSIVTNNPTSFTSFTAFTENFAYTSDQRLASTSVSFPDWSGSVIASASYNPDGTSAGVTFGDAASTSIASPGYNNNGQLVFYHLTRQGGAFPFGAFINTLDQQLDDATTTQADLMTLVTVPDLVGNPKSITDMSLGIWPAGAGQVSQSFTYSDDYRLRSVTTNSGADLWKSPYYPSDPTGMYPPQNTPSTLLRLRNESFTYDWRGNMTSSVDDAKDFPDRSLGTISSTGLGQPDQFGIVALANGTSATVSYDAAGELTTFNASWNNASTKEGYAYAWNELGQLGQAQRTDSDGVVHVTETYVYDRNGQRTITALTTPGSAPVYTVNVFDSLVLKGTPFLSSLDKSGDGEGYKDIAATANFYLSGGLLHVMSRAGMPVSTATNAGTTGVHWLLDLPDPRGSTAFVIDYKTGEVVERTAHQAYGAIDADYRPDRWKNFREDAKFTGQWDDAEVGLTYMGARYYSPQLARFISPDPVAVHDLTGINPYEYGHGAPLTFTDPSGLWPDDPDGTQQSAAELGAQLNVALATDPFLQGDDFNPTDPSEQPQTASDAPAATPEELPSESLAGPKECTGDCAKFLKAGVAFSATVFTGGASMGVGAVSEIAIEAVPFVVVNAARVSAFINSLSLAEQGIVIGGAGSAALYMTGSGSSAAGPLGVISRINAAGQVALDTNALIARLEGTQQAAAAVDAVVAGRATLIPYTVAREFLVGGGSSAALRAYLSQTGGSLLPPASSRAVQIFTPYISGINDARILGAAYSAGVQLITRDAEILQNTMGIAIPF